MDKVLIRQRFAKSASTYEEEASVQVEIARKMAGLLEECTGRTVLDGIIYEVGCGTGAFTRHLVRIFGEGRVVANDLCPEMIRVLRQNLGEGVKAFPGDGERQDFPDGTVLITSCSTVQWFEDPVSWFGRCAEALPAGGWLAFSTFGPDNVREVAACTGKSLPYLSMEEIREALMERFDVVHVSEERLVRHFSSPLRALAHLKKTGVTGMGSRPMGRQEVEALCRRYGELFRLADGDVSLTYHPIYMLARKKAL